MISVLIQNLAETCDILEEALVNLYDCGPEFEEEYAFLDSYLHDLQMKLAKLSQERIDAE